MSYRIVCCDLDGTLLDNQSEISAENFRAIEEMAQKGIHFVPSTGRTYSEIPEAIRNNTDIRYIIHSNGAAVLDKKTDHRYLTCMSNETVKAILDILADYEGHITLRHGGNSYVDSEFVQDSHFEYYNLSREHRIVVHTCSQALSNFREFIRNAEDVEVISVFFHSREELSACRERLERSAGLRVAAAAEYNLEIMNAHAGKGNALYTLADMLDIDRAATIAMGDSNNDESIVRAAGLGLAVSNACESLKAAADAVICSNEEHAVEYVLHRYCQ